MRDLNNPCGIVAERGVHWRGADSFRTPGEVLWFCAPWWSVRALVRQIMAVQRRGRPATPFTIASVLASASVSAETYGRMICKVLRVEANTVLDLRGTSDLGALVRAIAAFRTGSVIDDATLARGLDLAGIDVPALQDAA